MFDPPSFLALRDRHPTYRLMRDQAPVLRAEFGPAPIWILTRYDDVSAVLKDPDALVRPPGATGSPAGLGEGAAKTIFDAQLVLMDGPDHDRIRRLASPAFSLRNLQSLEAWLVRTIEGRIRELAERDEFDLVGDLAAFVPGATILHILGVPDSDWEPMISRVPAFINIFSPFPISRADRDACEEACSYYLDYFGRLVDERRRAPGDDIVGRLVNAHEQDDRLDRTELLALLQAFLNAGFETTMSTLGAGMYGMLAQEAPWRRLVEDPSLAPQALEETLRWEAPISFVRRYVARDTEMHGVTIPTGEPVLLALASANRDERKFDEPARILIDRARKDHVSFGGGRHFCIGAQLAKMEARTTLNLLARTLPALELLDEAPPRQQNLLFHSFTRLRVRAGQVRTMSR